MEGNRMSLAAETAPVKTVYADGHTQSGVAEIIREGELNIIVNQGNLARLICTRTDLEYLVTGFLFTERIIDSIDEIRSLHISAYEDTARVILDRYLHMQPVPRTDRSCCTGNLIMLDAVEKRPLRKVSDLTQWKSEDIFYLAGKFREQMPVHRTTESTHSCLLMRHGKILYGCEDIGQHNSLDKVTGYALSHKIPLSECIVYTSGRIPRDMTLKAAAAGIPVFVSKATPTAESVDLASEYGMTLICRAWENWFEMFTGF